MLIEVVAGSDNVKDIRDKQTQEIKGLSQEVYFHLPSSAFPVQGKIRVERRINPGKYIIEPDYRIGKYGDLEINPFSVPALSPAKPSDLKPND